MEHAACLQPPFSDSLISQGEKGWVRLSWHETPTGGPYGADRRALMSVS